MPHSSRDPSGPTLNETSKGVLQPRYLVLLLIFFVGLALRLYGLDANSLWLDEVKTVTTSRLGFLSMLNSQAEESVHPPLLYLVTGFFMSLLGESDFIIRLQAALLGSLSVLLTYKLGETLWTSREGAIGAFLLAINAYHIPYSQEARHYSLMVFLALLSVIFLLKALREDKKGNWILFALFTSLGLYTHYFALLILPGALVFAAWVIVDSWRSHRNQPAPLSLGSSELADSNHRSRGSKDPSAPGAPVHSSSPRSPSSPQQALHLVAALALVGLSYAPWLPFLKQQFLGRHIQFGGMGLGELPRVELSLRYFQEVLHAYTGLDGMFLLLFLALFALGLATCKARYIVLSGLWVTIPFLFPFVVRSSHFFEVRYATYVVPMILLLAARGIAVLTSLLTRQLRVARYDRRWRLALDSLLAVGVFGALSVAPLGNYYLSHKTDYRGVAEYLAANARPGDVVLADGPGYLYEDSSTVVRSLSYYMIRFGLTEIPVLPVGPGLAQAVDNDIANPSGEVWAVLLHYKGSETAKAEEMVATTVLADISVLRLRQPSSDLRQDAATMLRALTVLLPGPEAHFDIHLALAEICAAMGNQEEAATQLQLAKRAQPSDKDAGLHLAQSYEALGRLEDAVQQYLVFLQTPSAQADVQWRRDAYWGLGSTYELLGRLDQAVAAHGEVLSLYPGYWQAYQRLGDLHRDLGEPGEALAAYQRAVELQPQNAWLHLLLGKAYLALGRVEEATLCYQQVLMIDPDNEWAEALLASFSQPLEEDIPHPLLRSLGLQVALLGYDLHPATPEAGGTLDITLWWQALAPMDSDYSVFIHLTGPDGRVLAQSDTLLLHGQQPTSGWPLGLVAKTDYQLHVPHDSPPGEYTIMVGVYSWESGERLPVWDERGKREPADAIALSTVTVTESPDAD